MLACVLFAIYCAVSECVTVHRHRKEPDIQASILEELPPLFIACNLTDIVTISAPEKYINNASYFLYKPNNDVIKLNITNAAKDNETNKYSKTDSTIQNNTYSVRNVNFRQRINSKTIDVFGEKGNEFVIGPLAEEDHGNWVLSIYNQNNGSWIEMFQVITIHVTKNVPVRSTPTSLKVGGTLELGFAYSLPDIETCELILPPSVNRNFDGYFREYDRTSLATCNYVVRNLSTRDAGRWRIIGVGRVVYEGRVTLKLSEMGMKHRSKKKYNAYRSIHEIWPEWNELNGRNG